MNVTLGNNRFKHVESTSILRVVGAFLVTVLRTLEDTELRRAHVKSFAGFEDGIGVGTVLEGD